MLARSAATVASSAAALATHLIDLLAGRDAALQQILIARRLRLGVGRLRDVAVERRLRLLQRRLERPLVDRDEDLALLHLVAFDEVRPTSARR